MSDQQEHEQEQEQKHEEQEEKEPDTHSKPKKAKAKQGSGKRLTDKQRVEIIQIAENSKVSKRRLADKFGVTEAAIRKLLLMKDEVLKRYFDTPAEIRDLRLRGKRVRLGYAHGLDYATAKAVATICNARTTTTSLTSAAGAQLCNNGQYPPDDPWKQGLNAMLAKVSPFLKRFTRSRGQSHDSINVLDASVAAADQASVEGSSSVEDASAAVSELDWVGFSRMLRDVRRTLHRYPETGYQEVRTQAFIRGFCEQALHIPGKNIREMALTGLVVDVCHGNATISPSEKRKLPVIAFRADMDALPIEEMNEHLPYCSTQKNGRKELRKRKKRKTSTPQPSSPPKATEDEEDDPQASSDATGACVVSTDESMDAPATTLPAPSTITTTTVGAPPAPGAAADEDDSEFQSSTPAAHMCGHDGHMAIVLGLCALVVRKAHLLPEDTFVRFIFQPAEEGPGGAMKMIEDGALVDVDEVYGLHNAPFPLNSIHVRPGAVMAHEVEFSINIHGIGGHGSAPQHCVDPILAGSVVVQALQTIVSRSLSPMDTAVVSVTQFRGGDANNVIPYSAHLSGTIRDFDLQVAETIKSRVAALVHSTCASYGATASVHFLDGYAPVINPPVETRNVQQVAMDMNLFVSEEGLPLMAAEDFSYFLQERKGCYFFLGTKDLGDEDKTRALHSNHYDFNDKATPVGIRVFLGILQSRFNCELFSAEELEAFQLAMERILINHTAGIMADRKLSGRHIMELFYTEVDRAPSVGGAEEDADPPTLFRCKCGKTRTQRLKHGYTNLVQHVLVKHPDWVAAATRETYPSPVPAVANSVKSSTLKRNGKAKAQAVEGDDSDAEADGAAPDSNKPNSESREEEDEDTKTQTAVKAESSAQPKSVVQKRSDYLSWDDYFMSVAFLSAMRSKDPSTQVGACIVNPERKIVGIGYNGFPNGCGDDDLPWARESETNSPLDTKYPYVCHAEMNAILNKNSTDVKGCTIYVALFPCNECAKLIIQSGISQVVYCSDKYNQDWKFVASRRLLDMAGVQYTQHKLQLSKVVIDFTSVQ